MRLLKAKFGKGQKKILFLFFMLIISLAYFQTNTLIKSIERLHSKMILSNMKNYEIEESNGIKYYYKESDRQYIKEVSNKTKEMVSQVNRNFGQERKKKFSIVIYPNSMEMNQGLRLPGGEKTLGAYYGENIFMLSPKELNTEGSDLENIILHEYTHLLVEEKTKGNHPVWFSEGVALYQEYLITGYEWGRDHGFPYKPYSIEQLNNQFNQLDTFRAYGFSFLRVRFLSEEYGNNIVLEIMEEMGKNKKYDESIEKILGTNNKELENEFILWYQNGFYDKI